MTPTNAEIGAMADQIASETGQPSYLCVAAARIRLNAPLNVQTTRSRRCGQCSGCDSRHTRCRNWG